MEEVGRLIVVICMIGWIPILAVGKAICMVIYAIRPESEEAYIKSKLIAMSDDMEEDDFGYNKQTPELRLSEEYIKQKLFDFSAELLHCDASKQEIANDMLQLIDLIDQYHITK